MASSVATQAPMVEEMSNSTGIWYDEPVFRSYVFYSSILALKVLCMAFFTAYHRFTRKVFTNPEDTMVAGAKIVLDDPKVERVRRAHYNDLENILIFIAIGFFYALTKPKEKIAINLFRTYTAARFLHTVVYAMVVVRQPARTVCWGTGVAITIYMIIICLQAYKQP